MSDRVVALDARLWRASGIGTYIRSLVPRLARLDSTTTYHLLADDELGGQSWAAGANIRWSEARASIYSLREQWELPRQTPSGTNLLWSPHYNVPLLPRCPFVVTVQDLLHLAHPEFVATWHRRAYARVIFAATRRAAGRIFTSAFSAGEYHRLVGTNGRASAVIHLGVDDSWFENREVSSAPVRPYFIFVGNVKPHKNITGLLTGFASVMHRIPHDLVIVGQRDGFIHGATDVQRQAATLGDRVQFTGWIDDGRLRDFVANAEALVLPSFYEGFGLPPLEAMACGCPVIVSAVASLPEVCGDAAVYCDPRRPETIGKAIETVATDPVLRSELVAAGRERARAFTWERCATETAAFINGLG